MVMVNKDQISTGHVLEIVNEINRVSGVTTFSKNFFKHPYFSDIKKITISSGSFFVLGSQIAKCRVVYCHQLYSLEIFSIIFFCILFRKPIILVSHGNLIVREKSRNRKLLFLVILRVLLHLCGSSTQFLNENERARSFQLTSENFICPPYLSRKSLPGKLSTPRSRPEAGSKINYPDYRFCYLGANYYERKGFDRMFALCSSIKQAGKSIELDLIGVSQTNEISKKIIEFGLEGEINFINPVYGEEKEKLLSSYDALVLLSRSEGWPMVVLESIDLSVPVIVSWDTNVGQLVTKYEVGVVVEEFSNVAFLQELSSLSFNRASFFENHDGNVGFNIIRDKFFC